MKAVVLAGRILFSLIFLSTITGHFNQSTVGYAAGNGVPFASVAVPLSGIIAILGALSIIFGYKTKIGAWLIVLFLVPVTLLMHNFWAVADPNAARIQMAMFEKNLSMLGGALILTYFGAGPLSIDSLVRTRAALKEREKVRIKTSRAASIASEKREGITERETRIKNK